MSYHKITFFLFALLLLNGCRNKQEAWIANPPAGSEFCSIDQDGITVITDGGENFTLEVEESYIGNLVKCTVEVLDVPSDRQLINLTNQVVDNNFRFSRPDEPEFDARLNNPVPLYPGKKNTPVK